MVIRNIEDKEVSISGRVFRLAKLRHEMCDFLEEPLAWLAKARQGRAFADVFTFVQEINEERRDLGFEFEPLDVAILRIESFPKWWNDLGFKARNKARKAQKSGLEFRRARIDPDFVRGVEAIYNECPVRQGRKFYHYGKRAAAIQEELSSFIERSIIVGAYLGTELVGFMKLFRGNNVLRTIHIIATIKHRETCAMDGLIAKAVEICDQEKAGYFQYGSWTDGGVGAFREKYLFRPLTIPRYFVPLNLRGRAALALSMHKPLRRRLPAGLVANILDLRTKWYSMKLRSSGEVDAKSNAKA